MQDDLKKQVKDTYGAIAQKPGTSCCSSGSCCDTNAAAEEIGYTAEELSQIPDSANRGLGCGNPLGIASINEGETVLDLGSGAGLDVFLAANKVGENGRVIGVDMTPEMIDAARRNAEDGGYMNVEFRLGDIEDMPVDSCSIDLVISNCVLNLVPDKQRAFAEIVRVLKPGGRITISDVVLEGSLSESVKNDPAAYCGCISGAIQRDEYLQGLTKAGLADVTVTSESCSNFGFSEQDGIIKSITVTARKSKCCCC
ncbi:MAG: arsenite methyltransferase [Armatimonadota bacterium]